MTGHGSNRSGGTTIRVRVSEKHLPASIGRLIVPIGTGIREANPLRSIWTREQFSIILVQEIIKANEQAAYRKPKNTKGT